VARRRLTRKRLVGLDRSGGANFRTLRPPYCAPERGLLRAGAVLVNQLGRRFTNELETPELVTNAQPEKCSELMTRRTGALREEGR